eukprot:6212457-Pleurochrysis_carterae.AAC.4
MDHLLARGRELAEAVADHRGRHLDVDVQLAVVHREAFAHHLARDKLAPDIVDALLSAVALLPSFRCDKPRLLRMV